MPTFAGVDHVSLSVTDLDASTRFYTELLDFMVVLDFGYGRVCMHNPTGFMLSLLQHPGGTGTPFTELNTGLDHLGLVAASRDELVEWEQRFRDAGVEFTPIRDMDLGHHLNFRDPDGIALELYVPSEVMAAALRQVRTGTMSRERILEVARQLVDAEFVPR